MRENLATKYLREHGETVDDWDGLCGELANAVMGADDDCIYVEGPGCPWRFHMVPRIDGLIHDAWCLGPALPIKEWLAKMFCGHLEVSLNGDTIWTGDADEFDGGIPPSIT